ncbi:MAG: ATP synthase F1 subunit gamma [Candidatus Levybacteria bacterium]|nr:ATP synthase F1 subunit gamma [Candidatus Levybacteria bacterium]
MAQNLQILLRRKKTAQNIAQIARAMEMISASKIKKAQSEVVANKPYADRITKLTSSIIRHIDTDQFNHPYIFGNEAEEALVLIISPDKGLCGSLNTNLFKRIFEIDNKNLKLIAMGRKASQFSRRLSGELIAEFNIGTTLPPYGTVYQLIEVINNEYIGGHVSSFKILYTEFTSMFTQAPVLKSILPIEMPNLPTAVSLRSQPGSLPLAGTGGQSAPLPYIFEPKIQDLLSELLPYYLEVILYNSLIEAYTSEQAARMVAMQNAKNNALDIADYLTLIYNKSRQERITNELLTLSSRV